jgi:hypothetical protein
MIEDMAVRQFGPKTQHDYVRVVVDFARFLGRSPDRAEPEDLRRYQLHLAAEGASPGKMNAAVSALRFFCKVTLGRPAFGERLATVRTGERLPVVLNRSGRVLPLTASPSRGGSPKPAIAVSFPKPTWPAPTRCEKFNLARCMSDQSPYLTEAQFRASPPDRTVTICLDLRWRTPCGRPRKFGGRPRIRRVVVTGRSRRRRGRPCG